MDVSYFFADNTFWSFSASRACIFISMPMGRQYFEFQAQEAAGRYQADYKIVITARTDF